MYGLDELGRCSGLPLVLPTLLMAGAGALVASDLGQPARLAGLSLGSVPPALLGWALALTLAGSLLGALLVRLLIPLASLLRQHLQGSLLRRLAVALLQGQSGGGLPVLLWRLCATLLSVASGAPGGIMHDAMSLGALLVSPLHQLTNLDATALAQLAAVSATALFAAANGTPIFCAAFVFTLQPAAGHRLEKQPGGSLALNIAPPWDSTTAELTNARVQRYGLCFDLCAGETNRA